MDDHETEPDDLVERLEDSKGWPNLGRAAAARIREIEAENARLREALSRIVDASDYYGAEFRAEDQGSETLAYAHKSTYNLARAALEEKNDD